MYTENKGKKNNCCHHRLTFLLSSQNGSEMSPQGFIFINVLYRNTQYMKAQMSGKICSFKLIKTFHFVFVNVSWTRTRHTLATLLFAEVAPQFPNEILEMIQIWTWKPMLKVAKVRATVIESPNASVCRATLWIRLETNWNVSCSIQPPSHKGKKEERRVEGSKWRFRFSWWHTQRREGDGWRARFILNMKRDHIQRIGQRRKTERKGALRSQYSGSLHVLWS